MKNLFENIKSTFEKEDYKITDNNMPSKVMTAGLKRLPGVYMIPIERLKLSKFNLRKVKENDEKIEELSKSIKSDKILHPLNVKYDEKNDCYEVITGMRRYCAARKIGLKEIPCIIENEEIDNEKVILRMLVENLMREDLNPFEEAKGYKLLIERFEYNQAKLAEKFGRSKAYISQILSIDKIPDEIQEKVKMSGLFNKEKLIEVAKQKEPAKMIEMVQQIKDNNLSVSDIRKLSKKIRKSKLSETSNFKIILRKCKELKNFTELQQPGELSKKEFKEIIAVIKTIIFHLRKALKKI